MRNTRDVEMLTNSCFSTLTHPEGLMSTEQSNNSKATILSTSKSKLVIMLDHLENTSKTFDIEEAEPTLHIYQSFSIYITINTPKWNCCLGNMANVLYLMGKKERENFVKMNMDKYW